MARILFGWELGGGIGYASRLTLIARVLADFGHEPVMAMRDPAEVWPVLDRNGLSAIQAPYITGRLKPGTTQFRPSGFADLMACNGFGATEHLLPLLQAWHALLDAVDPALVIAEYSPVLTLAAYGRVPLVLVGSGYLLPPADAPWLPVIRQDWAPYADQRAILAAMGEAQLRLKRPVPPTVTAAFAAAERFVYVFPELDPYAEVRHEPVLGPLVMPAAQAPPVGPPRLFAYLHPTAKNFPALVRGLAQSGIEGECYLPNCPAIASDVLVAAGLKVHAEPPPLGAAIAGASAVLHHGGIDTSQIALALGRPQLIAPRHLDQEVTVVLVEKHGTGMRLRADVSPDGVAAALRRMVADSAMATRSAALGADLQGRYAEGSLSALARSCLALLSGGAKAKTGLTA
jgi:EryCIII-like glycosyltransferase